MRLLAELKRRNVIRMAGLYLVGAWLVVQVAETLLPAFDVPGWVLRATIILLAIGFVPALIFAWIFELTPQGLKRDEDVSRTESIAPQTAQRMNRVIVALLVLALGYFAVDKFLLAPQSESRPAATETAKGETGSESTSKPESDKSIAVLPFTNMSGNVDQDYFSDGMTEELLNVLAKVPQLKVVARTSVFEFKGKGGDVREIGRKLGVGHIVEGSVRRDGEKVRVTAQLIRVSDGIHVWSEQYDRKLESVFALQDEIAGQISGQLTESLGVSTAPASRKPIEPAAYDEYLKGRALLRQRKDMPGVVEHLKAAIAMAPDFAEGWSSLSLALDAMYWYEPMVKSNAVNWLAQSAQAAAHAQALAPDSALTLHVLGNVARERFDYATAEELYLRSISIDSSNPDVREDYSELLYLVGRMQDSLEATRQVVELDPYYIVGWMRRFDAAAALDHPDEVKQVMERMRDLNPDNIYSMYRGIDYPLAYSRVAEVRAIAAEIEQENPARGALIRAILPWVYREKGADSTAALAALRSLSAIQASKYVVARQDVDVFLEYVDSVGPLDLTYFFANLYSSKPAGQIMLRDPRIKAKLIEYGFVAYWRKKGWPQGCRPLGDDDFECGIDVTGAH